MTDEELAAARSVALLLGKHVAHLTDCDAILRRAVTCLWCGRTISNIWLYSNGEFYHPTSCGDLPPGYIRCTGELEYKP